MEKVSAVTVKEQRMVSAEKMATNLAIRANIDGISEIMGENATKILFRAADLTHLLENPPDYDWFPCVTTVEQGRLYTEVEKLVGFNGAIGIWRRMGYTVVKYAIEIGNIFDALRDLPRDDCYNKCLELFVAGSGKGRVAYNENSIADFDCFDCLLCEGHKTERPMCSNFAGMLQCIADWVYGKGAATITEVRCKATGDESCYFMLEKI
jgi:predicted hydrocarbon binding protein